MLTTLQYKQQNKGIKNIQAAAYNGACMVSSENCINIGPLVLCGVSLYMALPLHREHQLNEKDAVKLHWKLNTDKNCTFHIRHICSAEKNLWCIEWFEKSNV